jgi:peptidoglycan/LPS O-acetylase OafA/YrhL
VWYTVIAWETGLGWGTIGHLWSLAVEEQFYLVWPAAIFLAPRNYLPYVIGGTVLFAPLFRSGIVMAGGVRPVPCS